MEKMKAKGFYSLIGFIPKQGKRSSLLSVQFLSEIVEKIKRNEINEFYHEKGYYLRLKQADLERDYTTVTATNAIRMLDCETHGYSADSSQGIALFFNIGQTGIVNTIEAIELDKYEFQKYEIPACFTTTMNVFGVN